MCKSSISHAPGNSNTNNLNFTQPQVCGWLELKSPLCRLCLPLLGFHLQRETWLQGIRQFWQLNNSWLVIVNHCTLLYCNHRDHFLSKPSLMPLPFVTTIIKCFTLIQPPVVDTSDPKQNGNTQVVLLLADMLCGKNRKPCSERFNIAGQLQSLYCNYPIFDKSYLNKIVKFKATLQHRDIISKKTCFALNVLMVSIWTYGKLKCDPLVGSMNR